MQLHLLLLSFTALANAVSLPSISADSLNSKSVDSSKWWAQVGDRVFYAPPTSFLGLSQNVSDYYTVMGSKSALTPAMKERVVGSQGRYHIMHLPKGPSMLEVSARSSNGDRRSSFSAFTQLKSGTVLSSGFPKYPMPADYQNPLSEADQQKETAAVALIEDDTSMAYLRKLTDPTRFPTRSYSNADASDKVEHFLKGELEAMGLHTCLHTTPSALLQSGGTEMTNVVAYIPGTEPGAVIVGAHYDSRPFTGAAPGAEDNGSGTASLLATAKAFTQTFPSSLLEGGTGAKPKKSVFFALFGGEEPGLVGSKMFATALKEGSLPNDCVPASLMQKESESSLMEQQNGQKRKGGKKTFKIQDYSAIIMDEVGWLSGNAMYGGKPTVNLESYDAQSKTVMDHMKASSEQHNGKDIDVVHNGAPFGSDHMSFLDIGMGSVLAINGDDEAYPHYHKSTDSIENVNPGLLKMITKMNLGALIRMAV